MKSRLWVPDGFYRLVKWREGGDVINLSTGRSWPLAGMGIERSLFGPLTGPYDGTRLRHLKRIDLMRLPLVANAIAARPW